MANIPVSIGNNPFEIEMLTTQYTTMLELLLQQTRSKLRGYTQEGFHVGKMASPTNQIGVLEAKQPAGRYAPLNVQEPNFTRRWVFPNDRDLPVLVDQFDELRTIVDPKSGISMAIMAAVNRFYDDVIIAAFFAAASTGVDSSSLQTENFDTTNALVSNAFNASAETGMTYAKIIKAKQIMRHYQVDLDVESPCLIMSSQGEADLLTQQEVISKEYNDRPVVEDGKVTRIAGCDIIVSERLNFYTPGGAANQCAKDVMFVKSGMYLGVWKDMATRIDNRVDLSGQPWQIYMMVSAGATRLLQYKVIEIDAQDTIGFDPTAP